MSDVKKQLLDKIANKTAVVGIVGLGYVGLPLATELSLIHIYMLFLPLSRIKSDLFCFRLL